jgi:hypothetical protein
MFRKSPLKLGPLRIGFFHIADDGLPTIVDMDMFDADNLLSAMTQPSVTLGRYNRMPLPWSRLSEI